MGVGYVCICVCICVYVCVCTCVCVCAPIIGEGCWLYSIAEDVSPENNSRMITDEMTQPLL